MNDRILFPGLDALDTFQRTKALADDLARIVAGDLPTLDQLAAAPVINNWAVTVRPESCLVGVISGHPTIGLMKPGITTGLFAFNPQDGWARTFSRYYRLGRPAGDDGRMQ